MRTAIARMTLLSGLVLTTASFVLAMSPRLSILPAVAGPTMTVARPVPYLPALFILGIMLMFLAPVAYELWPDNTGTEPPARARR
jgi:hypothetical protein